MARLFVLLQYLLPHHGLSRLVGMLAAARWGRTLLIRGFIKRYGVDMSEAAIQDISQYQNFNGFFTRELRAGSRPLASQRGAIVCPADGSISQLGKIEGDRVLQAKGQFYPLAALLAGDDQMARQFESGSFATVYLSPRDYHRVHMPLGGRLRSMTYVPGNLFSVNQATANYVPGLFARNERVICLFDTEAGAMAVILVGAMIVAGIETVWAGPVCPAPDRSKISRVEYSTFSPAIELTTGAELGRFKLGSTAIVLFAADTVELDAALAADSAVRMGQLLATRRDLTK